MKLLVHACCGPCAIMPTRLLIDAGHDITVLYSNSNIAPQSEYEKRLKELQAYALQNGFEVIEDNYNPLEWEEQVGKIGESIKEYSLALGKQVAERAPKANDEQKTDDSTVFSYDGIGSVSDLLDDVRRKERCRACYRLRLEKAAAYAKEQGFDGLATTLAVSPYQFGDICEEELNAVCEKTGLTPLYEDYRPYYQQATEISRELGMYRQNYCGCRFSVKEAEATRAFVKEQRKRAKRERKKQAQLEQRKDA